MSSQEVLATKEVAERQPIQQSTSCIVQTSNTPTTNQYKNVHKKGAKEHGRSGAPCNSNKTYSRINSCHIASSARTS